LKIIVCVDGSESSWKAVNEAAKLVDALCDGKVSVLYVYENFLPATQLEGGTHALSGVSADGLIKMGEEKGKKLLEEVVDFYKDKGIEAETILKGGHPSSTITKVVSEGQFDMVVIGSRGMSGVKKFFLGSVSNAVAQEAETNVLIVK